MRRTITHKNLMGIREQADLLRDTLDLLILQSLAGSPKHGYGIARHIQQRSDDVLRVEEGALYPALHRLEVKAWLAAEWGLSESNRRAKYYSLTAAGREQLDREVRRWKTMSLAIGKVIEAS